MLPNPHLPHILLKHSFQSRQSLPRRPCSQVCQLQVSPHQSFRTARPSPGGMTPRLSSGSQGLLPGNWYKPALGRTQLPGIAQLWRQSTGKKKTSTAEEHFSLFVCTKAKKKEKEIVGSIAFANSSSHGLFPQKIRCVSRRSELPYQLFTAPPLRKDVLPTAADLLPEDPDEETIRCLHGSTAPRYLLRIMREGCGT